MQHKEAGPLPFRSLEPANQNARTLVSIVTPSFNQGRYLEQTILSVLDQTYSHIEYLVIDGGSTDGSVEIIKKYESKLAYWHSGPDKGFGDALAQGFRQSKGEILAYLNSDDLLAPDAVQKAVAGLARRHDVAMVYGNRVAIDEQGRFLYYKPNLPILGRTPYLALIISQEACFWRREAYFRVGGINTDLKFSIDYELFSKIALTGKVAHEGRVWGFFRKHRASKTMTQNDTVGQQEGARVQCSVWRRRVHPITWLSVQCLMKLYALAAAPFIKKPQWPACLPRLEKRNLPRRYFDSLHESSARKRFLRKFFR